MKRIMFICFLFISASLAGYAKQGASNANEKARGLQKQLKLSRSQTEKVAWIYKESAEKFERIRKEQHGDNSKMSVAIRPLRMQTINKIKAVLTPRQKWQYDKLLNQPGNNSGSGWGDGWTAANPGN